MLETVTPVGTKCEAPISVLRNVTIPEMPSRYHVALLNGMQTEGCVLPTEQLSEEVKVTRARGIQLENVLLKEGFWIGDRRKRAITVRWDSYADKRCIENFLHQVRDEKRGNRKYLHIRYSESEIAELGLRFKEETGVDRTDIRPQIEILKKKEYLREDGDFLVVNREKLLKQSLIIKELNEKGLEKYDLPEKFAFGQARRSSHGENKELHSTFCLRCFQFIRDEVFGVLSIEGKLMVHAKGCQELYNVSSDSTVIKLDWNSHPYLQAKAVELSKLEIFSFHRKWITLPVHIPGINDYATGVPACIVVKTQEQGNLYGEIFLYLRDKHIAISEIQVSPGDDGFGRVVLEIIVSNSKQLESTIKDIGHIKGVIYVERVDMPYLREWL